VTKTFAIRWTDEGGKGPLIQEIQEKPGSKASHKTIKASQLKSKLKGGAAKKPEPVKPGPPQVPALNFYQQTPSANTAGDTANSASNGGGNSTAATGARAESSSENGAPVVGSHDEDSNIDASEIIFQN